MKIDQILPVFYDGREGPHRIKTYQPLFRYQTLFKMVQKQSILTFIFVPTLNAIRKQSILTSVFIPTLNVVKKKASLPLFVYIRTDIKRGTETKLTNLAKIKVGMLLFRTVRRLMLVQKQRLFCSVSEALKCWYKNIG